MVVVRLVDWRAQAAFQVGETMENAGDMAAAAAAYRQHLTIFPDNAEAWFNLGNCLAELGDVPGSEQAYWEAASRSTDLPQAWFNLADVLEGQGRLVEAVASLERAVEIAPRFSDALFNLGLLYQRQRVERAERRCWLAFLKLVRTGPFADYARRRLLVA